MSQHQESVLCFDCEGQGLTGILAAPPQPASTAVLVVVGGPQYRAGSHRQFVSLCRSLADSGYAALRFDYRGMGDSGGVLRDFEQAEADIAAAIDALQGAIPSAKRIVLWGLCDGASAALLYLEQSRDPRVQGLCLVNPWVRSEAGLAKTQLKHYYLQRLGQKAFWMKLLRGQVAGQALKGLWQSIRAARGAGAGAAHKQAAGAAPRGFVQRMLDGWQGFDGSVCIALSENDYTAKEFSELVNASPQWNACTLRARTEVRQVAGADHTFSYRRDQALMEQMTVDWLRRLDAGTSR